MDKNWTVKETVELFSLCDAARERGESLSAAFAALALKTGRSVNSVRNYYYSQAKTFELVPEIADKLGIKRAKVERERFVPFTDSEVRELVERILIARGEGKSVRKAIFEYANGDARLALRYQNKYRSVLKSHRELVDEIARELDGRGIKCGTADSRSADNFTRLTEYIAALDEKRVGKFLSIIEKLT